MKQLHAITQNATALLEVDDVTQNFILTERSAQQLIEQVASLDGAELVHAIDSLVTLVGRLRLEGSSSAADKLFEVAESASAALEQLAQRASRRTASDAPAFEAFIDRRRP